MNKEIQNIQADANVVIRKLSLQIADLISEKTILESINDNLKLRIKELEDAVTLTNN